MANITAAQVKELRDKTGAGMMDAKKALVATDGDLEAAIKELREKGVIKAAKKSGRIAAEGLANVLVKGNTAVVVEVNAETDFVASNDKFKQLVADILEVIADHKPKDLDSALALPLNGGTVQDDITNATAIIGEKITLRRFVIVEKTDDEVFGTYLHNGGQIAVLVTVAGNDESVAKDLAMHVAAIHPLYVSRDQIPKEIVDNETDIATTETRNEGKPENIIEKIVAGRVNKKLAEITLEDQEFVKDSSMKVSEYVSSKNSKIKNFVRYEVGEGIEKKNDDFVKEVMDQIK
ncbi:translation elongation factor Ts [Xylocopilactobacillus apicola]|uniref:Elongation factor Ts n=1 Tax=Xylocopilactobacillus apicola TaxID=2932184 RepID=A0AAU9CWM4_9LACO|nr:translation elongation factor Ts [Xylocopilactobacillus apicola]BDR58387.1 elongation factor Ts [Xylocopilactobacillus apicola]